MFSSLGLYDLSRIFAVLCRPFCFLAQTFFNWFSNLLTYRPDERYSGNVSCVKAKLVLIS